jgi:hypothetical protein
MWLALFIHTPARPETQVKPFAEMTMLDIVERIAWPVSAYVAGEEETGHLVAVVSSLARGTGPDTAVQIHGAMRERKERAQRSSKDGGSIRQRG